MKDLIMIYGASVVTSIIYNSGIYYKVHKNARKKVMRRLRFEDDLTKHTKKELREMNKDLFIALLLGLKHSLLPGANVFISVNNYECSDVIGEAFEADYEFIVDRANEKEEFARKMYLETLRELKNTLTMDNLDEDIKENIDNDNYRPSRKTFLRAIKSMVYGPR